MRDLQKLSVLAEVGIIPSGEIHQRVILNSIWMTTAIFKEASCGSGYDYKGQVLAWGAW